MSNAWYVVNEPAGTDLLSLASGNPTPYVTHPGHIDWIKGDGNPINLRVFDGDPATNMPNAAWYADNVGPVGATGMPAIVFE